MFECCIRIWIQYHGYCVQSRQIVFDAYVTCDNMTDRDRAQKKAAIKFELIVIKWK